MLYIAVAPVIVLLYYIYRRDIDKEPRGLLFKMFLFGILSFIPILFIETIYELFFPTEYIPSFIITFISIFIIVGLVEEIAKWFVTYMCSFNNKEYNHPYDGIVYAVFASLGFAIIENIIYVFQYGFQVGVARALLAIPGHTVDAVFMGYFLSKAKYASVNGNNSSKYLLLSLLIPTLTHTLYDTLIIYYETVKIDYISYVFYIFVAITYLIAFRLVDRQSKIKNNFDGSSALPEQNTYISIQ